MVEVASRALSPGVNNPYTAIACIDNLTSVICYLAGVASPSPYRYDSEDKLRLVADSHNFAGVMKAAERTFHEPRDLEDIRKRFNSLYKTNE